jgi:streptogramin lyase
VATAPPPSELERYCAWYGTRHGATLYFGQAAFWSAFRARDGDPRADLLHEGPLPIGRFDLETETLLPPLRVDRPGSRSGVWDVLVHPGGSVFFTTFFEAAGRADPESGEVQHLDALGLGLNELAPGPDGGVLATRYGPGDGSDGDGGLVAFDVAGTLLAEWPIRASPGHQVAPKTPAWDPLRRELWATTDVLPTPGRAGSTRHPTFVLDPHRRQLRRVDSPEIQFVAFGSDGTGYRAVVSGRQLQLEIAPASGAAERVLDLDASFPGELDFVQDIQPDPDGRVVVTRWSGRVHVVDSRGRVRSVQLPRLDPDGLYYTAVLHGHRLCATYCADVTVVCVNAPD